MGERMTYETCCVDLTRDDVPALQAMIDEACAIDFRTFSRIADWQAWARRLGYAIGAERGLHLKDDYCVSFHASTWRGKPCVYADHSRIEHIFTVRNGEPSPTK